MKLNKSLLVGTLVASTVLLAACNEKNKAETTSTEPVTVAETQAQPDVQGKTETTSSESTTVENTQSDAQEKLRQLQLKQPRLNQPQLETHNLNLKKKLFQKKVRQLNKKFLISLTIQLRSNWWGIRVKK